MNRPIRALATATALSLAACLSTGCASIVNGPTQSVGVSSEPTGATVSVDGTVIGTTPLVAEIRRDRSHVVSLSKPPHPPRELTLSRAVSPWTAGNLVFGPYGVIGLGVDAVTGGLYRLHPPALDATLALVERRAGDPEVSAGAQGPQRPAASATPDVFAPPGATDDTAAPTLADASGPTAPPPPAGRRTRGFYVGGSFLLSSIVPLPLPQVDLGYHRERVEVRLRLPLIVVVGRYALEAGYAVDPERRTRVHATVGIDTLVFDAHEFVGIGVEHAFGRRRAWFVQLDATLGKYDAGSFGNRDRQDDRVAAVALSVGLRRR